MSAGSFVSALLAGWLSDKLGRKWALQIAAFIWIIGSVVTLSAQNVGHLIAGRVINGFTGIASILGFLAYLVLIQNFYLKVGIMSSQVPVYLAELSPKDIRGRVVGIQQWAIESVHLCI